MARQRRLEELEVDVVCRDDGVTICRLGGDLDYYGAPRFRDAVGHACAAPRVVIDLSEVPFIDSAGLGALIGAVRRLRDSGAVVGVCCSRPTITRLLHMTGFPRLVPLTGSVEEALAGLDVASVP